MALTKILTDGTETGATAADKINAAMVEVDAVEALVGTASTDAIAAKTIADANTLALDPANIQVLYESNTNVESFSTTLANKLATIEGSHFKGVHVDIAALELASPAAAAEDGSYAYTKATPADVEEMVLLDGGVWVTQTSGGTGGAMTGAQIKALYEAEADTNVFDNAEKLRLDNTTKVFAGTYADLAALEVAFPSSLAIQGSYAYLNNSIDPQSFAMLSSGAWVEVGAGGPTSVEIKALYEANTDTNVFDDATKTLVASALQAHQDISGKVDIVVDMDLSHNDYTDAEKSKLAGLEGSHFKGSHPDEAALLLAHPTAESGSYAYVVVHNNDHNFIWDDTNSVWVDSGAAGAVHLTDAQIKTQYENNPDTNALDDTLLGLLNSALQAHQDISGKVDTETGKGLSANDYIDADKIKLDTVPSMPTSDGEYVLKVVGGIFTWDFSSGGASVYDAYVLGSTVNADVTFSIYHKFDGMTEETRNAGVDLTDGQEYLVQPMYQSGLTDAHILDNVNMFTAKSFADQSQSTPNANQLYGDSGNPILGSTVKAWVNTGATIAIKYDTVFGALKATIKV